MDFVSLAFFVIKCVAQKPYVDFQGSELDERSICVTLSVPSGNHDILNRRLGRDSNPRPPAY